VKPDLTRWNRAGLKRFRYVDGNAATYLEALRLELLERLTGWDMELLGFKLDGNTPKERQQALEAHIEQFGKDHQQALDNYRNLNDNRGSVALEMIRSFARATHVLTEHLDAYANEGFLGTATQWENVRRLVYGLDYHPQPPASAMTHLVLHAKPGQSGLVASGLQIKHTPENGSPIVFETLEDIEIDAALNGLRLKDWDRDQKPAAQTTPQGSKLVLDGVVPGLKPKDPVIIQYQDRLLARLLNSADNEGGNTALYLDLPQNIVSVPRSDVVVHLKPVEELEVYAPTKEQVLKADVSTIILREEPVSSSKEVLIERDDYVFIGKGNTGVFRSVSSKVDGRKIELNSGKGIYGEGLKDCELSEVNYYVGKPEIMNIGKVVTLKDKPTDAQKKAELEKLLTGMKGNEFAFVDGSIVVLGDKRWLNKDSICGDILVCTAAGSKACKVSQVKINTGVDESIITTGQVVSTELVLDTLLSSDAKMQILLPPSENQWKWDIDSFVDMTKDSLEVGIVSQIVLSDLCVVACGKDLVAARVEDVDKKGVDRFVLQIKYPQPAGENEKFIRSQTIVSGKFTKQLHLKESNVNNEPIPGNIQLPLENAEAAKSLKAGKPIVIEQEGAGQSFLTSVKSVDSSKGEIALDSPLPDGYTTGGTIIRANVVLAGHGETQPERILGSGNATLSNQEFLFPVAGVSFVSDETQTSGVRADIHITVDGETWMQVSRFNPSRATDPHYVVRMTEEGYLRIRFGDGVNGRRLPTGENNVRIAWRMGSGTAGNLKAGTLEKLAHPHPRVEAIEQPIPCAGGNDMESVTSLRRSAPASLLTMERAVSVNDFALLAESQSSVWNARAEQCGERAVRVTIVLAEGGKLKDHLSLSEDIKAFLLSRAIPGTHVELVDYESEPLALSITLGINSARFDPGTVQAEVQKTLLQRFTLKNRAIGAPVYLSDIYQCVEAVRGVEYSVCWFMVKPQENSVNREESNKQFLYPEDRHRGVLHIAANEGIILKHEEAKK